MENYTPSEQNRITFHGIRATSVLLNTDEDTPKDLGTDLQLTLHYQPLFNKEKPNDFSLQFKIALINKEINFALNLAILCDYKCSTQNTQDFKTSDFVKLSAPAIAFPYIRSFISNITLNAGYNPVILPSFNFSTVKTNPPK